MVPGQDSKKKREQATFLRNLQSPETHFAARGGPTLFTTHLYLAPFTPYPSRLTNYPPAADWTHLCHRLARPEKVESPSFFYMLLSGTGQR